MSKHDGGAANYYSTNQCPQCGWGLDTGGNCPNCGWQLPRSYTWSSTTAEPYRCSCGVILDSAWVYCPQCGKARHGKEANNE